MIQYQLPLGTNQTNCYIIVDEISGKAAVIDPGDFNSSLSEVLGNPEIIKVEFILLTHGHYDHLLGAFDLKKYTGAKVAIHSVDAKCLEDNRLSLAYHLGSGIQKYMVPDLLLEDNTVVNLGGINIKTIHTPGHTPGSVCFLCENQKTVFSGDTLFRHDVGRTDLPGGSMGDLLESLKKLADLDGDFVVYPGHDLPTTLSEERKHNQYMRKIK